ncbi:MAG: TauD/TfdA family dioxygenase [Polyangiaceae bacterium]
MQYSGLHITALGAGGRLPLVVEPSSRGVQLAAVASEVTALVGAELERAGGLLFRGFDVQGVAEFQRFAASFGHALLGYDFGSTPRSKVSAGVYSSTEYPAHQSIPLHNEQSYATSWPLKIWFYCPQPAPSGGETPIADSRLVYSRIPARIRERWASRGLRYVRNYGAGLDLPWPKVFNTSDRGEVEAYCRAHEIAWEWKDDGELRTSQLCQAVARHPRTGEDVWFNQAHLFHVSALEEEVREVLLDAVSEQDLPRNVYYGDGGPLEPELLDEIRAVLEASQVVFPWQKDDILMLDNMLAAHARNPFSGPRKVVVAMAEPYSVGGVNAPA